MRKGIVLLTTIGLIMILSILILKSVDISQKYFAKMNDISASVQLNKTFLDVLKILEESTKEIKDKETLAAVIGLPIIINDEEGEINVGVDISSGAGVININTLILSTNATNEPLYNLLQSLLYEYRVTNGNLFMAILLDAIDKDKNERAYNSEAAVNSDRFTDGGILSMEGFQFLLDYFVSHGGDAKIYNIPWRDIVGFYGESVDFNYISLPLLRLLEKEYNFTYSATSAAASLEDLRLGSEAKAAFEVLNIGFFAPTLICDVRFFYLNQEKSLSFLYDIKSQKVGYIEAIF